MPIDRSRNQQADGHSAPLWLALAGALLWLGCATGPVECQPPRPLPAPGLPESGISAHRGGKLGCPDNSLGAFRRAVCRGVQQIEFDVLTTADAALVVAHDDRVTNPLGETLRISTSTLAEVQAFRLGQCEGETAWQHIPTLRESLDRMPLNMWLNVDVKSSDPEVARAAALSVAAADRFEQVMFATRGEADLAVRRVARNAGREARILNMNRGLFRSRYVASTISSCADVIQLFYLRGEPCEKTISKLKDAGVRSNYSWLGESELEPLRTALASLLGRGVDFVLVDHVAPAAEAACELGIEPVTPIWRGPAPFECAAPPMCP